MLTSWYFTLIKHDILVTLPRETGVDKWGPEEGAATTTLGGHNSTRVMIIIIILAGTRYIILHTH